MFQLLPCSRCQRTFSVRSEVSDQALLKCPNCGNQFRLGELLDAFYAPWEVLENPGGSVTAAAGPQAAPVESPMSASLPAGSVLAGAAMAGEHPDAVPQDGGLSLDGPDLELADDDGDTGISIEGATKAKPKADWSNFKPITHEEFQRMKRADRSPIWSTLQVVLGGAAAIPVSLLLIWHVAGKDVAGAGPAVARYVPWIVPKKFHGSVTNEAPEPIAEPERIPRRGESGFRNFDDVMPPADGDDAGATDSAKTDATLGEGGAVVGTLAEEGDTPEATSLAPVADPTEVDDAPAADSASAADQPMADVFALLKRTKQKVDGWPDVATAKDAVKRDAALSLFNDLSSLGAHFSSIPDSPGAPALARDKAQEISRAIKRQPDLIEVIFSAAKAQLKGTLPRSKDGWVLVCTIGEMLDEGDTWRIMVADPSLLPLDVPTIKIPKTIAPQLTGGQRLLLLGTFITLDGADVQPVQSESAGSQPVQSEPVQSEPVPANSDDASSTEKPPSPAPGPAVFRATFSYGL